MTKTTLEDMFRDDLGNKETLHDAEEVKRLFMQGSKIGKNIIKKETQLKELKGILDSVKMETPAVEIKAKLKTMYQLYESGKSLETKLGYLERTYKHTTLLGMCYNYTVAKIEGLEALKHTFETEIEGF